MRETGKLTARRINKIVSKGEPGRFGDGQGLYLQISQYGTAAWLLRYITAGRERQMGLGSLLDVPLALARQRAREHRNELWSGVDPIDRRREQRASQLLARARRITFEAAAEQFIAAHESGWKSAIHRQQWRSSLTRYAFPVIGKLAVADIDTALVLRTIEPIWNSKRETATRVRGRIEAVLDWATVRGFRTGDNPAAWSGRLEHLLPSNGQKVKHHSAMPYSAIPRFLAGLRVREGVSARALEVLVLTATRTGELINATWDEINLAERVWVVPANRMKGGAEYKVPLSDRVVDILESLPREASNDFVFIGARAGKPLSNMALLELMRDAAPDYVPHGFRSSFRDWCSERTSFPHEVAEAALAHKVPSAVVRAYQRTDFLDRRRQLMDRWAEYCISPPAAGETVVALRGRDHA
jgi:integrase